jgi:glycosyltransferase involved in cell wall biosynthesis
MPNRVGLAIVTCNRSALLRQTIEAVRRFTRHPDLDFIVADDGSADGTPALLRDLDVPHIAGPNMGVAWNKNRALWFLGQMRRCQAVIVLEDDTHPTAAGWEAAWLAAAARWGHVNVAAPWLSGSFESGSGTAEDPFLSADVTAQCAAYSRDALDWGGYFDPRFRGFGHEHVEHSARLVRLGFGGRTWIADGHRQIRFAAIAGDVATVPVRSHAQPEDTHNLMIAHIAMAERRYRVPWYTRGEMRQFRAEMAAVRPASCGFALGAAAVAA